MSAYPPIGATYRTQAGRRLTVLGVGRCVAPGQAAYVVAQDDETGAPEVYGLNEWRAEIRPRTVTLDLVAHLRRQQAFSVETFGPGRRPAATLDHIRKELEEIAAAPGDLEEWVDLVLVALDGAWRAGISEARPEGYDPEEIAAALDAKLTRNTRRTWPDWRSADPDRAIEHDREGES